MGNCTGRSCAVAHVGDAAEFSKTISESNIYLYAGITGDFNPAHISEVYAARTFFKTRIAHGMLVSGFISAILGDQLPGPGAIYVKQELNFWSPVRIGDTIPAGAEVAEIIVEKNRVMLKTTCVNQEGTLILEGEATVTPPKQQV